MTTPTTPTPDWPERAAERIEALVQFHAGSMWLRIKDAGMHRDFVRTIREEFAASGDTVELREALRKVADWTYPSGGEMCWCDAWKITTNGKLTYIPENHDSYCLNARRVLARHTSGKEGV